MIEDVEYCEAYIRSDDLMGVATTITLSSSDNVGKSCYEEIAAEARVCIVESRQGLGYRFSGFFGRFFNG